MASRGSRHTRDLLVDGDPVARIEVANTFWRRFRGLMLRRHLPEGLLLEPESSVHGMWMLKDLDIAFLDARGEVLAVAVLRPWRVSQRVPETRKVLEAPAGNFTRWGLEVGSHVEIAN